MLAETSLMIFSFLKKNDRDPGKKPSASGGLRSQVYDAGHGAHPDGDAIVLSEALGGGRYPCRPAGPWMSEETDAGMYRLVFQPVTVTGRRSGPPMVTANIISRGIVEKILAGRRLSGLLSVYTPERSEAEALMSEALGYRPIEYGFTGEFMGMVMDNMRGRPWERENQTPGPVCFFGDYVCAPEELELPENAVRCSDAEYGCHVSPEGTIVLSSDLGGTELDIDGILPWTLEAVGKGEFGVIVDSRIHPDLYQLKLGIGIGDRTITREQALAICCDRIRPGMLSVYTPDRADALELMQEAVRRRPVEAVDDPKAEQMSYFQMDGEDFRPRAYYGTSAVYRV